MKNNVPQLILTGLNGYVAQQVEHRAFNLMAAGSSPAVPKKLYVYLVKNKNTKPFTVSLPYGQNFPLGIYMFFYPYTRFINRLQK